MKSDRVRGHANSKAKTDTDSNHNSNGNGRPKTQAGRRSGSLSPFKPVLITGGAGFIGTNVAAEFLESGQRVLIFDNLSRPGVERNLEWLSNKYGPLVDVEVADVRNRHALDIAVASAVQVFHFAAQVAVTTSLMDPEQDFEVNARGTLNLLEALRRRSSPPPLLFTSTNKVYGDLRQVRLRAETQRYVPVEQKYVLHGASEQQPLDFHSPYGCSKGVADQYVLDYSRCYRLPAVVFRMSCIYGPHQCGTEDQGWVAHFILRALRGEPITLYGDGRQVRDVLYVEDLIRAMFSAIQNIELTAGHAFNMGGGPQNTCSLLELLDLIRQLQGNSIDVRFAPMRQGDQRYYVSDTRAFTDLVGWTPGVGVNEGVRRLHAWLREQQLVRESAMALA